MSARTERYVKAGAHVLRGKPWRGLDRQEREIASDVIAAVRPLIEADIRAEIKADIDELEPPAYWTLDGRLGYTMARDNAATLALQGVPRLAGAAR